MAGIKYSVREITHGQAFNAYAPMLEDGSGYEPFKGLTGMTASEMSVEQSSTSFYADNQVHYSMFGLATETGTLTAIQDFAHQDGTTTEARADFAVKCLGKKLIGKALADGGEHRPFAWLNVETVSGASEDLQATIYYNLVAGTPTANSATDNESVTPKEFQVPVTAGTNNIASYEDKGVVKISFLKSDYPAIWSQIFGDAGTGAVPLPAEFATAQTPASATKAETSTK